MHLLTFLNVFEPGPITRGTIFLTQFGFGSLFIGLYVASPRTAHRLVGYIEEMAVVTYTNLIEMIETPGTKLHEAWSPLPAPEIARTYVGATQSRSRSTDLLSSHRLASANA